MGPGRQRRAEIGRWFANFTRPAQGLVSAVVWKRSNYHAQTIKGKMMPGRLRFRALPSLALPLGVALLAGLPAVAFAQIYHREELHFPRRRGRAGRGSCS